MALVPADPLPTVSAPDPFLNPAQKTWLAGFVSAVRSKMSTMVDQNTAADYLMIKSPDGNVHKLTVDNDGNVGSHPVR